MTKTELTRIIKEEIEAVLQESPHLRITSIGVGYDHEECSKRKNMYAGCSKYGSPKYPRQYYPKGWEYHVKDIRRSKRQNPTTWEIFGRVTDGINWQLLLLHRYMMTDYGPTGSDVRQVPQMLIGRVSQWTKRIARLDPKWQYAKEDEKQKYKNAVSGLMGEAGEILKILVSSGPRHSHSAPRYRSTYGQTLQTLSRTTDPK